MKQEVQLQAITEFTERVLGGDKSGHDMSHIHRVVQSARAILATEPTADPFIVIAAATLHDTYDDKLFTDVAAAKADVVAMLIANAVSSDTQAAIFFIIDNMSWSKTMNGEGLPLDINGQIVQDADRLDAIGAMSIARVFIFGGGHGHIMYDPAIKPRTSMSKAEYRRDDEGTMINHFYEKLLLLVDHLNTTKAKTVGAHRQQIMLDYLAAFKEEWDGKDL
ncbi:HD domain-containing protein [Periweissella cryptocerci]|uniref:HD domain-containing protein n=1 Tax=Periweissella cryptocerci TaxID=2506420 RepID=A0A4P6YUD9_9LACO|nr:HD domain-containing protein [Periweissella cryptocerci]QBO36388.1 HD domain-containing protein [Periweissella cryptocerci]